MTTVADATARHGTRPRADALRNRERIVAAAREMFVEHGPQAPLDEIARRAGIGNATLYRHFADRRALIHEVVLSVLTRTADHAETAAAEESDPFTAVCRFAHAAADEGIGAMCGMLVGGSDQPAGAGQSAGAAQPAAEEMSHADAEPAADLSAQCRRLECAVEGLMRRAQRAGRLRPDVTTGDLVVALSQLTRPLPGLTCPNTAEAAHRHLQLFLDGLRSPAPSELPGPATTLEDLRPRRP